MEANSESEQAAINRKHDLIDALTLEETQKLMIAARRQYQSRRF